MPFGDKWPFPGDSPMARSRKMGSAYRAVAMEQQAIVAALTKRLAEHEEVGQPVDAVSDLDQRFTSWGETWHVGTVIHREPDDMIPAAEAGEILQVSKGTISRLRARGRIKGEWRGHHFGYFYKVRDVYALSEEARGRGLRSTVSIHAKGETAPQ